MERTLQIKQTKIDEFSDWLLDPNCSHDIEDIQYRFEKMLDQPQNEGAKKMEKATFKIAQEHDEYQVQVFEEGKQNHDRTYFTDDMDDAIETFKAMVEEEERNQDKEQKKDQEKKDKDIHPTDNLKTALSKTEIPEEVAKAIIEGYEGTGLDNPISEHDNFFITDLLLKTVMVFNGTYEAWNVLLNNPNIKNRKKWKKEVQKVMVAAQNKFTSVAEITQRLKYHKRQGHEVVRLIGYYFESGSKRIADIFELTVNETHDDSYTCFTKAGKLRAPITGMLKSAFQENTKHFEIEKADYEGRH